MYSNIKTYLIIGNTIFTILLLLLLRFRFTQINKTIKNYFQSKELEEQEKKLKIFVLTFSALYFIISNFFIINYL